MYITYIYSFFLGLGLYLSQVELDSYYYSALSKKSEVDKRAIQMAYKPTKRIVKKYGFKWYPASVARASNTNLIDTTFEGRLPLDTDEVRNLYFTVAAELLEPFNSDLEYQKHITSPPFNMKNLCLMLYHNKGVKYHERDRVVSIENKPGKNLLVYEKVSEDGLSEVAFKETVDEALKKIDPEVRKNFMQATKIQG